MSGSRKRDCQCPRARHKHGTNMAYNQDRCRCLPCKVAHAKTQERRRRGLGNAEAVWRSPVGVVRRLQALHAIGWTWQALGDEMGICMQVARNMVMKRREYVHEETHERVCALYDRLWNTRPEGAGAHRARLAAARKGYAPPMAWDDDTIDDPAAEPNVEAEAGVDWVAVDRALAGQSVRLNAQEKQLAVRVLKSKGTTRSQAASLLGLSGTQVKDVYESEAA